MHKNKCIYSLLNILLFIFTVLVFFVFYTVYILNNKFYSQLKLFQFKGCSSIYKSNHFIFMTFFHILYFFLFSCLPFTSRYLIFHVYLSPVCILFAYVRIFKNCKTMFSHNFWCFPLENMTCFELSSQLQLISYKRYLECTVYTHSTETIYLSLSAQAAVGIFS